MVTSSNLQPWARVDIVLKSYEDPAQTLTLKFTNRPALQGDATYLPLLLSYSGLSLEVGQDGFPSSGSGSITIADNWNSFGENRRVFDLFDRYTPINQTVTVYRCIETIGDLDMPSSWTAIYTGKVTSYSKSKDSLVFAVTTTLIESKLIGRAITEETAEDMGLVFTVPESSLGKVLPLVFGQTSSNVIVPAYSIAYSETEKGTASYAYCAQFGTQFIEETASSPVLYAKDAFGEYVQVTSKGSFLSAELQNGTADAAGSYPTSHGKTEFLAPLDYDLRGCICTQLKWWCRGQSGGYVGVGGIVLSLYRKSGNAGFGDRQKPTTWEQIASVEIPKSDYTTQFNSGSDFWVKGVLETPVVLKDQPEDFSDGSWFVGPPPTYAVGVRLTNYTGSSTTDATSGKTAPMTSDQYYLYRSSTAGEIWTDPGSVALPLVGIDVADFTFDTGSTDATGLSYRYVILGQDATQSKKCDLQQLDLAVRVPPLKDDGSGTLTGTIDKPLYEPDEVVKLLGYTWNGSSWVDGNIIDTSTFSSLTTVFTSGNYQRHVRGFAEGETTNQDLIAQIAKETCCFLVPLSSGKIALWPWGAMSNPVRVFTDAEIIELSGIEETDPSTVINNIRIGYSKNYLNIFDQWEASGQASNLGGVVAINKNSGPPYSVYLGNSETIYGKRELEQTDYQFIGDSTSATTRALYLATRHDHTHRVFSMTVPYFDNTDLKLMDVIDVISVHLPSFLGSSSNGRLPTYNGIENDVFNGEYPKQAQRRRCQIIGINNDYDQDFPKLVLKVREIKPRHFNDPTAENL